MLKAFKGDREDFACAESSFFVTQPKSEVYHLAFYGEKELFGYLHRKKITVTSIITVYLLLFQTCTVISI